MSFQSLLAERGLSNPSDSRSLPPRFVRLRSRPQAHGRPAVLADENTVKALEAELGVPLQPVPWLPFFYALDADVRISRSQAYRDAVAQGIDAASGLCVRALDPHPDDRVLDLCCAPGAKLAYIADLIGNEGAGSVTGVDVSEKRLVICRSLLRRMGVPRSRLFCCDGRTFDFPPPYLGWHSNDRAEADGPNEQGSGRSMKPFYANRLLLSPNCRPPPNYLYTKVLVDAECTTDGSFKHLKRLAALAAKHEDLVPDIHGSDRPVSADQLPQLQKALLVGYDLDSTCVLHNHQRRLSDRKMVLRCVKSAGSSSTRLVR